MTSRWWFLLLAALLSGACSGGDEDGAGGASPTTTTSSVPTSSTTSAAGEDEEEIAVVLGTGRLTVGGNALVLDDAPASQVSAYLERALGEPTDEADETCGPGELHILSWPGLDVFLLDDLLVGWVADDAARATDKGIRLGSTRAELTTAYPAVTFPPDSSLGDEFFVEPTGQEAAGLSGVIEAGRVAALWSGATCVAR